jgi:site-specific DNA recombinase
MPVLQSPKHLTSALAVYDAVKLFDAVQQKLTDQWTAQSAVRNASDHLLTGLLFDDAGYRMVPTHATKFGVRYRYYVSLPHLHGESKTASVRSVSPIPATEIEDVIIKSLHQCLIAQKERPSSSGTRVVDRKVLQDSIARIDVHEDHLAIRLRSADVEEKSDSTSGHLLSIPWQKPPSRRSRKILVPHGTPRDEVRPTRIERRARLVSAIARGRRWLDEIVSGSATDVQQIATRQNAACGRST